MKPRKRRHLGRKLLRASCVSLAVLVAGCTDNPEPRAGDSGVPLGDSGVPLGDSGVPLGDSGVPLGDSGVWPDGDQGGQPHDASTDSSVPDGGAPDIPRACTFDNGHWTCQYRESSGVDPNLLSLDIYPTHIKDAPIMVYVHGGGWGRGDKSAVHAKAYYFASRGYVFASVNYRLSPHLAPEDPPEALDPDRLIYPVHEQDVATAVGFLKSHDQFFGGDGTRISLIGHSAGAGIVSLVGTDQSFLAASGVSLADDVMCVIPLDIGGAYDLEWLAESEVAQWFWWNAFGPLEAPLTADAREAWRETWIKASPIHNVAENERLPSFFIVTNDSNASRGGSQSERFRQVLSEHSQAPAVRKLVLGQWRDGTWQETLTHAQLNHIIGDPNDDRHIMPTLEPFLLEHCGASAPTRADNPFGTLEVTDEHWGPGTEVNYIVPFEGALYAVVSTWNTADRATPVQILRKDGPTAPWVVDMQLPRTPTEFYGRGSFMAPLTFGTDINGAPLASPVTLLVVGADRRSQAEDEPPADTVWVRRGPQDWVPTVVDDNAYRPCDGVHYPGIRSADVANDPATGRSILFVGSQTGRVYRGGYDPSAEGLLRFERQAVFQGAGRISSITSTSLGVYISAARKLPPDDACTVTLGLPEGLFRYVGGAGGVDLEADPKGAFTFIDVWGHENRNSEDACRGLTLLPHPERPLDWVLMCAAQDPGELIYWERLRTSPAQVTELDLVDYLKATYDSAGYNAPRIGAYNTFTPFTIPQSSEAVHLVGLYTGEDKSDVSSYVLVRYRDGAYDSFIISSRTGRALRGTRTICPSPWAQDRGRVLYFGGFDAHHGPHQQTGWILEGTLR
jgi:arylformamidase